MLLACKKSVPDAWKEFDFPMDGVKETQFGTNDQRLTLQYDDKASAIAPLKAMDLAQKFGAKIEARGWAHACKGEYRYLDGDRIFIDGYTKDGQKMALVEKFGSKPDSKLEVVVTKKYDTDMPYGGPIKTNCK